MRSGEWRYKAGFLHSSSGTHCGSLVSLWLLLSCKLLLPSAPCPSLSCFSLPPDTEREKRADTPKTRAFTASHARPRALSGHVLFHHVTQAYKAPSSPSSFNFSLHFLCVSSRDQIIEGVHELGQICPYAKQRKYWILRYYCT